MSLVMTLRNRPILTTQIRRREIFPRSAERVESNVMMDRCGSVINQVAVIVMVKEVSGSAGPINGCGKKALSRQVFGLMAEFGYRLMSIQLTFESLYRQALMDWPEEIDLRTLQYSSSDLSRYTIKGLGTLSDEIEERYIG